MFGGQKLIPGKLFLGQKLVPGKLFLAQKLVPGGGSPDPDRIRTPPQDPEGRFGSGPSVQTNLPKTGSGSGPPPPDPDLPSGSRPPTNSDPNSPFSSGSVLHRPLLPSPPEEGVSGSSPDPERMGVRLRSRSGEGSRSGPDPDRNGRSGSGPDPDGDGPCHVRIWTLRLPWTHSYLMFLYAGIWTR